MTRRISRLRELLLILSDLRPSELVLALTEHGAAYFERNGWDPRFCFIIDPFTDLVRVIHQAIPVRRLAISHVSISAVEARALTTLPHLSTLHLYSNDLGSSGARTLSTLKILSSLSLVNNNIGDAVETLTSLTSLTFLDLSHNNISDIAARKLAALTSLKEINLSNNVLSDDGARSLASLTALTQLKLSNNNIGSDGARSLATLPNLTSLSLDYNNIGSDGAHALASLTKIMHLSLDRNSISDRGAHSIASLTSITSLFLNDNIISSSGAHALTSLPSLTYLGLSNNRINDDGIGALSTLSGLRHLSLRNNPIKSVPAEILQTSDAQAIFAAYRRYTDSRTKPLNEAKLLVVGNEAVGKTSLIRFLTRGEPRNPDEQKTAGVAHQRIEKQQWSPTREGPRLNVWDFGGQEIMHETHKFFLTERSIYLLVLEDRREDDTSIYKWLKTITNRGGESPIIIVINKCDDGQHKLLLDDRGIAQDWPSVVAIVRTSCNSGDAGARSIEQLKSILLDTLTNDPRLAHVRDALPEPWRRVKEAVTIRARDANILTHQEYVRICESADCSDKIDNDHEQRGLLGLLHDLGVVVAHGRSRDAPAAIQTVRLLDPNWLTEAIYKLLTAGQVVHQSGVLRRGQLAELLSPDRYPPHHWEFILSMMQLDNMGLCFPLPGETDTYLIPEALPKNTPDYDHWPTDSLRFRFDYDFLPSGLVPRLIVEAHQKVTETRWRSGAIFTAAGCKILVRGNIDKKTVDIQVTGSPAMRRSALNVILEDLRRVHALNPEAKPEARVPLPGNPESTVSYEHLLRLEERHGPAYLHAPEGTDREYSVGELLDGVGRDLRGDSRLSAMRLPRLVVLMVSACPDDAVRLAVDREYRRLHDLLRASEYRDRIDLRIEPAADYDALERALRTIKPQVLHLSCHGTPEGDLHLADDRGGMESIPKDMLLGLLKLLARDLKLVLLNACHSATIANELQQTIDVTLGMSDEISDEAAIAFTRKFYEIIADGESVKSAFDLACNKLRKYREQSIPLLFPTPDSPDAERKLGQGLLRLQGR